MYFLHLSLSSVILTDSSCTRLDVVHPGCVMVFLACVELALFGCSLHYLFLTTTPLFPHGVTIGECG